MQNPTCLIGDAILLLYLIVIPQTIAEQIGGTVAESDWEGLKALYTATSGDAWTDNSNWNINLDDPPSSNDLAHWYGITLSDGRVTELNLSGNGLAGVLPAELGNLSSLRVLDLQENELSGSIGPWIGNLAALAKLYLQQNRLAGPIPDEIGNLIHLEYLNLRGNQLQGVIPESLRNLQALQGLWLHVNRLSGSISQNIIELPGLEWLWLGENPDLSGIIPLTNSNLSTTIDFYLGGTDLCIEHTNANTNVAPVSEPTVSEYTCLLEEEWKALKQLYAATGGDHWIANTGWNFDSRPKAESVGSWHGISVGRGYIRALQLELNHLDGLLPPGLSALTRLEILRVDGNPLHGPVPEELSSLKNLKVFSADETQLCTPTTAAVQLWLADIPTVLGLEDCADPKTATQVLPSGNDQGQLVALPLWLVVGFGVLGILGAGAALITAFTKNRRPEEAEEEPAESNQNTEYPWTTVEQRLDALIEIAASMSAQSQPPPNQDETMKDFSLALKALRSALNERDQEIKRLKRGHDNAVFRKFVVRFIRVDQAIQYFLQNTEDSASSLESIHSLMEDALLECDVQPFSPEIGSDYRSAFGVADHPKIFTTTVQEKDCRIVEVLELGYIMQGGQEKEVLVPARVSIYRFKPEE